MAASASSRVSSFTVFTFVALLAPTVKAAAAAGLVVGEVDHHVRVDVTEREVEGLQAATELVGNVVDGLGPTGGAGVLQAPDALGRVGRFEQLLGAWVRLL